MTAKLYARINALIGEVRQLKGENNQLRERNAELESSNKRLDFENGGLLKAQLVRHQRIAFLEAQNAHLLRAVVTADTITPRVVHLSCGCPK